MCFRSSDESLDSEMVVNNPVNHVTKGSIFVFKIKFFFARTWGFSCKHTKKKKPNKTNVCMLTDDRCCGRSFTQSHVCSSFIREMKTVGVEHKHRGRATALSDEKQKKVAHANVSLITIY